MPSKQFLKGKHQLTLYPTTNQLTQLKIKMRENGYKVLTKYLIDMGLNATVKTTIEVDSTHKNNTKQIHEFNGLTMANESKQRLTKTFKNGEYPCEPVKYDKQVTPLPKGGK